MITAFIHPRRIRAGLAALSLVLAAGPGCAEKPKPPPLAYQGPTLAGADLGLVGDIDTSANGFVLFRKERTRGLFPASLAVVRLVRPDPLFTVTGRLIRESEWVVGTMKTEEAAWLNSLFRTMPEVQQVVIFDEYSVRKPDLDLDDVVGCARRVRAELCLIFGPKPAAAAHAGLAGVVFDTATGRQLAYVQADAGPEDFTSPRADRPKGDLSHLDVNFIAARKFDHQLRECMAALIALDEPRATTQPIPYVPATQPEPVPLYVIPNRRMGY